ncbi:MAG: hypothetical protein GF408_07615 [Candidatus Omnitrophica bacterium]|nr:hypothetical protein [Candidatus Omnitrophota bacterium]
MDRSVKILFAGGNEELFSRISEQLRKDGMKLAEKEAGTLKELETALREEGWDAVIPVHGTSSPDTESVINTAHEVDPDLPVVVVSAIGGGRIATGLMRAGANDFISEGDFGRLSVNLEREIRDANFRRERRQAEKKVVHLNKILKAIRSINHLVKKDLELDELLDKICGYLTENREYSGVWVYVRGENGEMKTLSCGGGISGKEEVLEKKLKNGEFLKCRLELSNNNGFFFSDGSPGACGDCEMENALAEKGVFAGELRCGERAFGMVVIRLDRALVGSENERALFVELVEDISYALYSHEAAKKKEKLERERERHIRELEIFQEAALGREERILELKKEVKRLRGERD